MMAQNIITKGKEVTVDRGRNKNAPTKAPNFPLAAAIPPKVALISLGNVSEGRINVVNIGPPLKENNNKQYTPYNTVGYLFRHISYIQAIKINEIAMNINP